MTASIEKLIGHSKERERLQSELQIAHEVQAQLFPRSSPRMDTIEALGVCQPAQSVSGDFYDYVRLGDRPTGVVVRRCFRERDLSRAGDGGGPLHAADAAGACSAPAARTYPRGRRPGWWRRRTASSAPAPRPRSSRRCFSASTTSLPADLHYCNAGHLPPMLCRRQKIHSPGRERHGRRRLSRMPSTKARPIELIPGDLLCAFTDGVSEPENRLRRGVRRGAAGRDSGARVRPSDPGDHPNRVGRGERVVERSGVVDPGRRDDPAGARAVIADRRIC
jgi:phosphoserine phosphatase RsbU/P